MLKPNMKAFWDTFAGLVPVHVESITGPSGLASSQQTCLITVTSNHGPYKAGEQFERSAIWVVPPECVKRRKYSTAITPYAVESSDPVTRDKNKGQSDLRNEPDTGEWAAERW